MLAPETACPLVRAQGTRRPVQRLGTSHATGNGRCARSPSTCPGCATTPSRSDPWPTLADVPYEVRPDRGPGLAAEGPCCVGHGGHRGPAHEAIGPSGCRHSTATLHVGRQALPEFPGGKPIPRIHPRGGQHGTYPGVSGWQAGLPRRDSRTRSSRGNGDGNGIDVNADLQPTRQPGSVEGGPTSAEWIKHPAGARIEPELLQWEVQRKHGVVRAQRVEPEPILRPRPNRGYFRHAGIVPEPSRYGVVIPLTHMCHRSTMEALPAVHGERAGGRSGEPRLVRMKEERRDAGRPIGLASVASPGGGWPGKLESGADIASRSRTCRSVSPPGSLPSA